VEVPKVSMLVQYSGCQKEFEHYVKLIEWLEREKEVLYLGPDAPTPRELVAEYMNIDLKQLDEERKALSLVSKGGGK
jgi:hypothetical protein